MSAHTVDLESLMRWGALPLAFAALLSAAVPASAAQFNTAAGAKNTLRITVNAGQTAAYINDRLFVSLAIKPTEVGGFFGLGAARIDANPASWAFANFTITDLP